MHALRGPRQSLPDFKYLDHFSEILFSFCFENFVVTILLFIIKENYKTIFTATSKNTVLPAAFFSWISYLKFTELQRNDFFKKIDIFSNLNFRIYCLKKISNCTVSISRFDLFKAKRNLPINENISS